MRVVHRPSGARGESREQRSQVQNKRAAFLRMTRTGAFRVWLNRQLLADSERRRIDAKYAIEGNVRVDIRESGRWVEE